MKHQLVVKAGMTRVIIS